MSGIVGCWHFDGRPVNRRQVNRMADTLSHRGPDAQGVWVGDSVGLGHRKLEVTPESVVETQPLVRDGGRLVVTADARIDNRDDLIGALRLADRTAPPITAPELILEAYEKWGASCPEHLVGAYAFMIWDRSERRLLCVRDHLGIKPLFYYNGRECFVAASELKALLALPEVPRRINKERVAEHLVVSTGDAESTFYRNVFRVPPAHTITVSKDSLHKTRYWTLDTEQEVRLGSEEAYAEALREQFLEAVECRLRSAHPVGSALSGGLDSSSIACAARDSIAGTSDKPLHTFSVIFPSFSGEKKEQIDERDYMNEVLDTGGFEPHFIQGGRHSPLEHLDDMISHIDQAFWAPNLYLHWPMFSRAQETGVRVFLDGLDGDGAISRGFQHLNELLVEGRLGAFDRQVTALAERYDGSREGVARQYAYPVLKAMAHVHPFRLLKRTLSISNQFDIPLREIVSGVWVREALPSWMSERFLDGSEDHSTEAGTERSLIRTEVARKFDLTKKALRESRRNGTLQTHRETHVEPFLGSAYPTALDIADKISAAFGIETRYPFFDRRLIELSVSFPATTKLCEGWPRYIFRRAMDGILPEAVQWRRRKAQMGANFDRTLLDKDASKIEGLLQRNASRLTDYVDPESFRAVRSENSKAPLALYTLSTLAAWLEQEMMTTERRGGKTNR